MRRSAMVIGLGALCVMGCDALKPSANEATPKATNPESQPASDSKKAASPKDDSPETPTKTAPAPAPNPSQASTTDSAAKPEPATAEGSGGAVEPPGDSGGSTPSTPAAVPADPALLAKAKAKAKGEVLFAEFVEIDGVPTPLVISRTVKETEDDVTEAVVAKLHHSTKVFSFHQRNFAGPEEVSCEPPKRLTAPPGMTVLATGWCEAMSCGGGCLRTQPVLYIPHEDLAKGRWYELSCNENLSAYPDAEVNDACDELDVTGSKAEIVLETTNSQPCFPDDVEGRIRRATVKKSTIVMSPQGAELKQGKLEPYRKDLWGCPKDPPAPSE